MKCPVCKNEAELNNPCPTCKFENKLFASKEEAFLWMETAVKPMAWQYNFHNQKYQDLNKKIEGLENRIETLTNIFKTLVGVLKESQKIKPRLEPATQKYDKWDAYKFAEIDWIVLEQRDNRLLLLSERILEEKDYHSRDVAVSWGNSTMRDYLKGKFYNRFSNQDKERIYTGANINKNNQWFNTPGGNDTIDHVFLLSLEELVKYFGDENNLNGKDYKGDESWDFYGDNGDKRIAYNLKGTASWWWLRSPGYDSDHAAGVDGGGRISVGGNFVSAEGGVRPALWLNL